MLVPNGELNKNPRISPELAQNQTGTTTFFKNLVSSLAVDDRVEEEIPVSFLAASRQLAHLVVQNDAYEVLVFLEDPRNTNALVSAVWSVLGEKSAAAYPLDKSWVGTQRLFAVWLAVASYPITKLKNTFASFKEPSEFENHMAKMLRRVVGDENSFNNVILQWVEPVPGDENLFGLVSLVFTNGTLFGKSFHCANYYYGY